jgi:hypothetical protein
MTSECNPGDQRCERLRAKRLLSLVGLGAAVAAVVGFLHQRYGTLPSDAAGVALFSGGFAWLMTNLLYAAVKAWRERSALVATT